MIKKNLTINKCGCSCGSDCSGLEQSVLTEKKRINIEFLYLDLNVCKPCQGTENSLEDAISDVAKVLEATNVEVVIKKINVTSAEQAINLRFVSSPTIRINGRDIQLDVKESLCESCGDLCGDNVDCRVWMYQGKEYAIPPKAMIIEAILREVYGTSGEIMNVSDENFNLPDNLKKFYARMREKEALPIYHS